MQRTRSTAKMMGMLTSASGIREVLASNDSPPKGGSPKRAGGHEAHQGGGASTPPQTEVVVPPDTGPKPAQLRSVWRRADILIAREGGTDLDDHGRLVVSPTAEEVAASGPISFHGSDKPAGAVRPGATRPANLSATAPAARPSKSPGRPSGGPGPRGGRAMSADGLESSRSEGGGYAEPVVLTEAAGSRLLDVSQMTKKQIRAIISKDEEGGVSGSALMTGLEQNVKTVLLKKRREHDGLKAEVSQLLREREALTLRLRDLQMDGQALGFAAHPDRDERMAPVDAITRKPVFTEGTDLRSLVEAHQREVEEREQVRDSGQRYTHMFERLGRENVALRRRVTDLEEARVEEAGLENELAKRIISAQEHLGSTKARLEKLRKDIREEKALWLGEIADQRSFLDSKAGFETFLEKQLERHKRLEQEAERRRQARADEKAKRRNAVNLLAHTGYASRLQAHLQGAKSEEAELEEAFRRLGAGVLRAVPPMHRSVSSTASIESVASVKGSSVGGGREEHKAGAATRPEVKVSTVSEAEIDPVLVIRVAEEQHQVWQTLATRLAAEEARLGELGAQLEAAKAARDAPETDMNVPSAHRDLAARESALQTANKEVEAERARLDFAHASIEPVRLGLQVLAERLLNVTASLDAPNATRRILRALRGKIAVLMDECRRMKAQDADGEGEIEEGGPSPSPNSSMSQSQFVFTSSPVRPGTSSANAAAMAGAVATSAVLKVSEYNVRVPAHSPEAQSRARRRAGRFAAKAAAAEQPMAQDITAPVGLPDSKGKRTADHQVAAKARLMAERLPLWGSDVAEDGRPPQLSKVPLLRGPLPSVETTRLDEMEALDEAGGDPRIAVESRTSLAEAAVASQARAKVRQRERRSSLKLPRETVDGRRSSNQFSGTGSTPMLPLAVPLHPTNLTFRKGTAPRLMSQTHELMMQQTGRGLSDRKDAEESAADGAIQPAITRSPRLDAVQGSVEGGWEGEDDEHDEVWDRSEVKKIARNILTVAARRKREEAAADDD
jgi:hypothetical protein